jgi:hypothetical protein
MDMDMDNFNKKLTKNLLRVPKFVSSVPTLVTHSSGEKLPPLLPPSLATRQSLPLVPSMECCSLQGGEMGANSSAIGGNRTEHKITAMPSTAGRLPPPPRLCCQLPLGDRQGQHGERQWSEQSSRCMAESRNYRSPATLTSAAPIPAPCCQQGQYLASQKRGARDTDCRGRPW